ncbi:MAG: LptF/LptG family permease [Bacteroidales bacterium]|nr:LptF/LptG family permease [Bacteroidales bacterium]
MKRLHLLVLRSFIGPFILIFFIVLFVLLMQFLWKYIDELVGKGLEFHIIGELLLYTTASLVPLALPLSVLMSSLMAFGNLGEFNELTAMKASGISLQKVMIPMIAIIVLLSIGSFYFSNEVLPFTNLKMRALLYDVRKQRPDVNIIPGTFYNDIEGYSLRVEDKDPSTNTLYGIRLYDHTGKKGNTSVTIAKSGKYRIIGNDRFMEFTLFDGHSYNEVIEEKKERNKPKTHPHRFDSFKEQVINIELKGFGLERTDEKLFRNHYALLDIKMLRQMADSVDANIQFGKNNMVKTVIKTLFFKKRHSSLKKAANDTVPETITPIADKKDPSTSEGPAVQELKTKKADQKPTSARKLEADKVVRPPASQKPHSDNAGEKVPAASEDPITTNKDPAFYHNLFGKLTLKEKDNVLSSAVSYARSARTYISTASNSMDAKTSNLRKFEIEIHRKYTLAFACFLFLLIGAPLGAIIRKGGLGIPVVLSALLFIFYYIVSLAGEKVVRESFLPAYQGMWAPSAIYLITGFFLSYKAATDAAILNLETYTNLLRKYLGIRRTVLLDKLDVGKTRVAAVPIKHDKIISALGSFRETISDNIHSVSTRLKFSGFLITLAGFRESTNIILFERLYKNIIASICSSDLASDKAIMNKLYEFPNFRYRRYLDLKWILYIRLVLLLIPPFTLIIMIRQYVRLMNLKGRLIFIQQLTTDLIRLLQKHDILDS